MTTENISWSISTKKTVADPVGIEPATSWSPVGRASNWAIKAGLWADDIDLKVTRVGQNGTA